MKKFYGRVLNKRVLVIFVFLAATILAGMQVLKTKINPDISSYLDKESMSKKTLNQLHESFGINGDILIGIGESDLDEATMLTISNTLGQIASEYDEIQEIDWIGNQLNRTLFLAYNATFTDVDDLLLLPDDQWTVTPEKKIVLQQVIGRYYQMDASNKGCFILYFSLSTSNTSEITYEIIDRLDTLLRQDYTDYYIGGTASKGKVMLDSALNDLPKFLIAALVVILLILFLTTKSFIEPIIFLVTIGIAIVLNLGTNFVSGGISTVTFSAAAILQLALAMDYSIFLMHSYYQEREKTDDRIEAMKQALHKTNRSIAASALTTIGGFVALFAMKFRLGFDLGFVLAKGVAFSFITVMILQPCLILISDKLISKTSHKYLNLSFRNVKKGVFKTRFLGVIVAVALFVPALVYQNKVAYYYLDSRINTEATGAEAVINDLGSQLIVIVDEADQPLTQMAFLQDVMTNNATSDATITSVIGYYPLLQQISTIVDVGHPAYASFQTMDLPTLLAGKFFNNNQTYYVLQMHGASESAAVINNNKDILQIMDTHFTTYAATGNSQVVLDFESTTKSDFILVSILSALIILLILILTYRQLFTPLLLLVVIELGIFINLSITHFIGQPINFMSYLIISAIQLGATIDYAILLTTRFKESHDIKEAIGKSGMSILVSIAILVSACMSVFFISSDPIIKEITFLIARGSVISGLLVFFILPRLLVLTSKKKLLN